MWVSAPLETLGQNRTLENQAVVPVMRLVPKSREGDRFAGAEALQPGAPPPPLTSPRGLFAAKTLLLRARPFLPPIGAVGPEACPHWLVPQHGRCRSTVAAVLNQDFQSGSKDLDFPSLGHVSAATRSCGARRLPSSPLPFPRPRKQSPPCLTAASRLSSGTAATPVPGSPGSGLQTRRFLAGLGEKKE